MAKKIQKVLALLMALSLCMSLLSVTAFAAEGDENQTVEFKTPGTADPEGDGTGEADPKITITVKPTETDEDGNTSQTTETKTEWSTGDKDNGVEYNEKKNQTIVADKDSNLIRDYGTVDGSKTTTSTTTGDRKLVDTDEPIIVGEKVPENVDPTYKNGSSDVTVNVTPGGSQGKGTAEVVKPDDTQTAPTDEVVIDEKSGKPVVVKPVEKGDGVTETNTTITKSETTQSTVDKAEYKKQDKEVSAEMGGLVNETPNVEALEDLTSTDTVAIVQKVLTDKGFKEEVINGITYDAAIGAVKKIQNSDDKLNDWEQALKDFLDAETKPAEPITPGAVTDQVQIKNVELTVGDADENEKDAYHATVKFEVVIVKNKYTNTVTVTIKQDGVPVGKQTVPATDSSVDGEVTTGCTVMFEDLLLVNGKGYDIEVDLEGVQEMENVTTVKSVTEIVPNNNGKDKGKDEDKEKGKGGTHQGSQNGGNPDETSSQTHIYFKGGNKNEVPFNKKNITLTINNRNYDFASSGAGSWKNVDSIGELKITDSESLSDVKVTWKNDKGETQTAYLDLTNHSDENGNNGNSGQGTDTYDIGKIKISGTPSLQSVTSSQKVTVKANTSLTVNVKEGSVVKTSWTETTNKHYETVITKTETTETWHDEWDDTYTPTPETKPDPDPDHDPDPKPNPNPDPKPNPKPETKPETKPEPKPEPKPTPDPEETVIGDNDIPLTDLPEENVPLEDLPDEEVSLEEIPEEEVPLASVPETGDMSVLWLALTALSGTGLAGVSLLGRKKQDEE